MFDTYPPGWRFQKQWRYCGHDVSAATIVTWFNQFRKLGGDFKREGRGGRAFLACEFGLA